MRYLNLLSIVLLVLQLTGFINVSWWLIVAPTILYILLVLLAFITLVILEYKGYGGK
ncbi:hypothetical protein NGH74_13845 [Staphylococcus pseudoxylosus]|uniref:hypothetical protein n=1 Tax=Staphylococcus pseudoxylosus TaxID=2282419 RepID=UPI002DBAE541|nr:hypothetical protein [Staphylococcus pseudoxylosus]MEB8088243.1 hypothetical protein [Staphylococcus pseudoxylosus]